MTHKARLLKTLNRERTDKIPYFPRLDLWYNANKRAGNLPAPYQSAPLKEIVADLGFGFHGIVPNFKDLRQPDDDIHRGLGVYNLWNMPCRTVFQDVDIRVERAGDETSVTYVTPRGTVRTRTLYDESMRAAGISISHLAEPAIKSADDYAAVAHLFDNAIPEPNHGGYVEFAEAVGEDGIAAAFLTLAGSPVHLLLRELMDYELFMYEQYDHPDEMAVCAAAIGRYFDRMFDAVIDCPFEVTLFGANYDAMLTYPPLFAGHVTPWLKKFAAMLHAKGKFLLTHTDGENTGLLEQYLAADIDIADSVCPKPMTKLSFKQVRDAFGGRIAIMGGIPSVCLLPGLMGDRDFEAYLDEFFGSIGPGEALILGISDTTPPAADFGRIKKIGEYVEKFGPVTPARAQAP